MRLATKTPPRTGSTDLTKVPSNPSVEHVRALLAAGMTPSTIATQAAVARETVRDVAAARHKTVTASTEQALLAVSTTPSQEDTDPLKVSALSAVGGGLRVGSAPVIEHVRLLVRAGWSQGAIADAAGVSRETVRDAARARHKTMSETNARALLSVPLSAEGVQARYWVGAVGAMRRLRALQALGWSRTALAEHTGISLSGINAIIMGRNDSITAANFAAVRRTYAALSMRLPQPGNGRTQAHIDATKTMARQRGWYPPLDISDDRIDNPAVNNYRLPSPHYVATTDTPAAA